LRATNRQVNTALRGKYAIVGVGQTRVGDHAGASSLALLAEAMVDAVADAGLQKSDIDGLITRGSDSHYTHHQLMGELLGIDADFSTSPTNGGASPCLSVITACMAIEAGLCSTALCGYGLDMYSMTRRGDKKMAVEIVSPDQLPKEFRLEYGYFGEVATYALGMQRHMHAYGTTKDQLGAIAVALRGHAAKNPLAQLRKPIALEDYRAARPIVDPLGLLDCAPLSDGAGAVVVTTAERARDLARDPAYILGFATANNTRGWKWGDHMIHSAARRAADHAYRMAGVGPKDIDTAQLYDCFTYEFLVQLDAYGFCGAGEGGPFAASGALTLDGALPSNTAGGLLSEGHIGGIAHVVEAVRQVRREHPADRRVKDAEIALVSGHGGNSVCHATLILSRAQR
jgi:acetyl-CoA acetyltransferase